MATAADNKKRGSKFEGLIEESAKIQAMTFTRLRDVPHLTQRIMTLERQLRACGQQVMPGSKSVKPNPCDCIITGDGVTVHYEAKSTTHELRWSDIKQYERPGKPQKNKVLNDYWVPQNAVLSGIIVEFCDVGEYLFIPLDKMEKLRQERKTGFDYERASHHGIKVEVYKPTPRHSLKLDLRALHSVLSRALMIK